MIAALKVLASIVFAAMPGGCLVIAMIALLRRRKKKLNPSPTNPSP